jgi:hypothetical protein
MSASNGDLSVCLESIFGGGGGSQSTTSSTVAEPWQGVQPFLTDAYGHAQDIYAGGPPGYYPGQTLAAQSPYTQAAIGLQAHRGLLGSPMVTAAQNGMGAIAGGQNVGAFAPAAAASNQAITGLLGNPLTGAMQGQAGAGMNALGLIAGGGFNPLGNAADQAGGTLSGLMSGQGLLTPGLQGLGQQALAQSVAGENNPVGQGAAQLGTQGLLRSGQQGIGIAPQLGQAGSNALGNLLSQGMAGPQASYGAAQDAMTRTLRGDFLSSGNPHLANAIDAATRPMVDSFQRNVVPGIQSLASGAGRYGSGAMSDAMANAGTDLTRQIGDVAAQMAMANHGAERQNMLQSAGLALQDRSSTLGQQLGAVNSAFNALAQQGGQQIAANQGLLGSFLQGSGQQQQGLGQLLTQSNQQQANALQAAQAATQGNLGYGGQQLQGLSQVFANNQNMGNQLLAAAGLGQQGFLNAEGNQIRGAQLVPGLAQQDFLDINQLGAAGSLQDQFNQAAINADVDRWNYNATAPMQWTSNYLGMLNGAPWGSMTRNSVPGPSGFQSALQTGGQIMQMVGPLLAMAFCWVAREVYDGAPRWLRIRELMLTHAPASFLNWYLENGPRLAAWLRENPEHKPALRARMDAILKSLSPPQGDSEAAEAAR